MPFKVPPQPSYTSLHQTPKGPHHVKHRRSGKAAHRDSSNGAGDSTGRTTANDSVITFAHWTLVSSGWATWSIDFAELTEPDPIPHAGIRAGEIIGWRCWKVLGLHLQSIVAAAMWFPRETMKGNIDQIVFYRDGHNPIYGGVFSFNDISLARLQISDMIQWRNEAQVVPDPLILGSIKMWGEVVEHEQGYRAQYAKIASLETAYGMSNEHFEELKGRYGV